MIQIAEQPILTDPDRLDGELVFLHEKLNKLEQHMENHRRREETLLRSVQMLLHVIEKAGV